MNDNMLKSQMCAIVVFVVRRKAACKQKRDVMVRDNPFYTNTAVVTQEEAEMQERGIVYSVMWCGAVQCSVRVV